MPRQRLSPICHTVTPCRGPREEGPGGEGTYEIGAGENLASTQYLLLWWFICVLWLDEAGRAAGVLTVLQRWGVTFINAFQRTASHTPVEVVHALPLQVKREICNMSGGKLWATLNFYMLFVNKIIDKEKKNILLHKYAQAEITIKWWRTTQKWLNKCMKEMLYVQLLIIQ